MKPLHDPVLPGVAVALDVDEVRGLLGDALPDSHADLRLEKVKIYDVQYQPRTSCTILYSVKFRSQESGRSQSQLLSGVLLADGETPAPPAEDRVALYRASGERPIRVPLLHLPRAGMVAYGFPFDPRMPNLLEACDPGTVKVKLDRMWRKRAVRTRRVAVEPLSYTPGARAAILYETLGECRHTHLPEMRHLVGKIDRQREAALMFARHWAVWRQAAPRIQLPPPVGYLPDLNMFLQERVDGVRLADEAGSGSFIGSVRQVARSAAVLHALELPLTFRRPFAQKAKAVHRWGSMLSAIRPHERRRIHALRDRLAVELESRATLTGPVHGDLHPSNVLVNNGRVTLIDLDNMTLGDRLLDVGRFLSALRTSSLRVCGTVDGLADAGEGFLEHYLSHTGEDERRARVFEAASLLITAGTGFRLQREGWEETSGLLIDEAERVFGRVTGRPGRARGVAPETEAPSPTGEAERLHAIHSTWAGDPQYARAVLEPHVRREYGAELGDCRIDRKRRSARSERLRYRLSGWRGDESWKLSVEGVLWSPRSGRRPTLRLAAVREALAGNPRAPLLPRPVGYVAEVALQVLEPPRGIPLASRLERPEAAGAVESVARALAALHATPVELDKSRGLAEELRTLRSRVERSCAAGRLARSAPGLLERIEEALDGIPSATTPVLRHLPLRGILLAGERVALAGVDDVVLSHPLLDAAEVAGRLTASGLDGGGSDAVAGLAARFCAAYVAERAEDGEHLPAFEAAALLRMACAEAELGRGARLLAAAERRLAPSREGRAR